MFDRKTEHITRHWEVVYAVVTNDGALSFYEDKVRLAHLPPAVPARPQTVADPMAVVGAATDLARAGPPHPEAMGGRRVPVKGTALGLSPLRHRLRHRSR